MNLKRVKIGGLQIFKIHKEDGEEINLKFPKPEASKTKKVQKKIKKGDGDLFTLNNEGEAYQVTTFIHKKNIYAGHAPNLIHIYFDQAMAQIQWSNKYADSFQFISKQKIADINIVPEKIFYRFIQLRISSIIFLHLSIEAFINYIIPEDFKYTKIESGNSDKFSEQITKLSKKQIERWTSFKEKVEKVIPQIEELEFETKKNSKIIGRILEIGKIRDEIIHLKSKNKESKGSYKEIFNFIGSRDLTEYMHSTRKFMNILENNFIKIENVVEKEDSEIIRVDEEKYLNMTLLFNVVRIRKTRITIYIKKWKGLTQKSDKIISILHQLQHMDDMKIIYDYLISEEKKHIKIEIFKTDEQII